MTLRKVPGALALGLLASLAAHGGLFGDEHAMGGNYHALLGQLAATAAGALLLCFGLLALRGAGAAATGSVLAARLSERLPPFAIVFSASALWYAAAECLEPQHAAAPLVAAAFFLALASWLIVGCARFILTALAEAVIAVRGAAFAPRTPAWLARVRLQRPVRRIYRARRRFARPPPIGIAACA